MALRPGGRRSGRAAVTPTGGPGAGYGGGLHRARGGRLRWAEQVCEESLELVSERVTTWAGEKGLDHDEDHHYPVDDHSQNSGSHYDTERRQHEFSHEAIVGAPSPPRYPEATAFASEIPPEGQDVELGSVVPRAQVRLVIVDDHALVREGTSRLLNQEPDLCVVGTAGSSEEAMDLFQQLQPDVALVDVSLPGRSGLELARWSTLSVPVVRVVILSAYDDIAFVDEALNTGVAGYLLKTASGRELAEAVRAAADGVFVLDTAISRRLARRGGNERPQPTVALTPREAEVLSLVARGLPNKRIAAELGLGVRTVEGYVSGVLGKLGAASRTEAALYALSHPALRQDD